MRADHVVVGGGVVGTAVAWHLASRGRETLLLEADELASGASGGPGLRGVRANGRDPAELRLMPRAHELWPRLGDEIAGDTGWRGIGHLLLAERDEATMREQAAAQARAGVPTEYLDRARLTELEPGLSEDVIGASFCPADGVADHTATTRALAAAAGASGAEVREGARVESIDHGDGVVRVGDEEISVSGSVVVAANAGVGHLVDLPLFPVFPQVLVTKPLEEPVVRHLIGHAHRPLSMKALADGAVMITGARLGQDGSLDPAERDAGLADAVAVLPALEGVPIEQAAADRAESATIDLLPIVDQVAADTWVAAGWSGHGFAIGPVVAELLADWILTGRQPELLVPFAADRF